MTRTERRKAEARARLKKILSNILFTLFMVVMVGLIFVTAQSRFTGKEPMLLGHRLYIVDSGSMSPTIKVDSMIIVKESEAREIEEGDIITYYGAWNSTKVTHRVMEVRDQGKTFITKGDANTTDDPLPLEGERIIGKVVFFIPYIGMVFRFLSSIYGIIALVVVGAIWLIVPMILARKRKPHGPSQQTVELKDPH